MPAITDVAGVLVGHAQNDAARTGCTVLLFGDGATTGVDVRGGAPGTHETDLLAPTATVQQVHALLFAGGSAFGLAAAAGVMHWLQERKLGFDTGVARIPIVPAAVIFDLAFSGSGAWPNERSGYTACAVAEATVAEGSVGAGTGATVGKALGVAQAMKGGVGSWSETLPDGTVVGALAVVNAFGDVLAANGSIIAGARLPDGRFANTRQVLRLPQALATRTVSAGDFNTTLVAVATNAQLDKVNCTRLAQMAQDGLARTICPAHTPVDGDIVFATATGAQPAPPLLVLGTVAADVVAEAIRRAVQTA
jgi:L-aminopeptidase/D-esterase-like protein